MEQEAREILRSALVPTRKQEKSLVEAIRERFGPLGGVELDLPKRGPGREPPDFSQ